MKLLGPTDCLSATLDASRYAKDFPELKQITCG
jgi:hypothetical protein